MVIFKVFVGGNNSQNNSFNMSYLEGDRECVSIRGNVHCAGLCNGNYVIMQVENVKVNKIFGEWYC
jgi:hypothetical protein